MMNRLLQRLRHLRSRRSAAWLILLLIVAGLFVSFAIRGPWKLGRLFRGKQGPTQEAAKEKEKVERAPDFEPRPLRASPSDDLASQLRLKPGHWTQLVQPLRANNFDFVGNLTASAERTALQPQFLQRSGFYVISQRPASLPKQQLKEFPIPLFVPLLESVDASENVDLRVELTPRRSQRSVLSVPAPYVKLLKPRQCHIVVLADRPDQYTWLKSKVSIRPPRTDWNNDADYFVLQPKSEHIRTLPDHFSGWTTIAYLVWDRFDPAELSAEQQQALVDWLHWGGQIIISGPNSLEQLHQSFLTEYLPARGGKGVRWAPHQIEELATAWSIARSESNGWPVVDRILQLENVELQPVANAAFLPHCADLICERMVGRGRIVITAFPLAADAIVTDWSSFDNLFNACLLRRPARRFILEPDGVGVNTQWSPAAGMNDDAERNTQLRYFSRTRPHPHMSRTWSNERTDDRLDERETLDDVVAWNDFGEIASVARWVLDRSAGIEVPSSRFVTIALISYLAVLIPANWLVFRLAGRVEWAWIAMPILAIVAAIGVVRLAQLDVGFARSRTDLNIIETHAEYPRAHVSRFIGLYTSLSTPYVLSFSHEPGCALPFSVAPDDQRLSALRRQPRRVTFQQQHPHCELHGLQVLSNSTAMYRAEHMWQLPGTITWSVTANGPNGEIHNQTPYPVHNALLIQSSIAGRQVAYLGTIPAGETIRDIQFEADLGNIENRFHSADTPQLIQDIWPRLRETLLDQLTWRTGDVRLLAWSDTAIPIVDVRPNTAQHASYSIWVTHLRHGALPPPEPDQNLPPNLADPLELP